MADILDTVQNLISSPPGQLVAGAVLAGIVWKFFERVEAVLTDHTKLEIAVWLLDRKPISPKIEPWPDTFAKVFDQVFGNKHLSWTCFWRSCVATLVSCLICSTIAKNIYPGLIETATDQFIFVVAGAGTLFCFDYLSLLETRYILTLTIRWRSGFVTALLLPIDLFATAITGAVPSLLVISYARNYVRGGITRQQDREDLELFKAAAGSPHANAWDRQQFEEYRMKVLNNEREDNEPILRAWLRRVNQRLLVVWAPTFFTSIWLWLYAGSGFLLKAFRHFDIGFQWFNRKFDIERKPLQSIGLVAGALVAVVYWAAVIVMKAV